MAQNFTSIPRRFNSANTRLTSRALECTHQIVQAEIRRIFGVKYLKNFLWQVRIAVTASAHFTTLGQQIALCDQLVNCLVLSRDQSKAFGIQHIRKFHILGITGLAIHGQFATCTHINTDFVFLVICGQKNHVDILVFETGAGELVGQRGPLSVTSASRHYARDKALFGHESRLSIIFFQFKQI
ncbi:hypothetical protein BpHYR1_000279 [Brachionus plicatilis]|uniref:Uncharacterized protein n=1 Tax=Brachionus plicatilis TaxID=10195 RepID=A0A3M7TDZ9_BRAPC|nr:hypothetical protein BpHYR1_000279 [Brachionus plicatilis]